MLSVMSLLELLTDLNRLLTAAAAVQGVVLALLAWRRRQQRPALAWFAGVMLALGVLSATDYVEDRSTGAIVISVALLWVLWVPAPALWLYVRTTLGLPSLSRWQAWWHFVPAALMIVPGLYAAWQLQLALGSPPEALRPPMALNLWMTVLLLGTFCSGVGYIALSLYWLARHRQALHAVVANVEAHELRWLSQILILALVILSGWLVGLLAGQPLVQLLAAMAQPICMLYLGIRAIEQPYILGYGWLLEQQGQPTADSTATSPTRDRPAYARSGLSRQRTAELMAALEELMRSEKPYLEDDLTLPLLAERLGVAPQLLSQLLNQTLGTSFHDYIADHRVRDVMRCLHDRAFDQQTILQIATDAGFRSKSAFHDAFKRVTGTTPGRYRMQRQSAASSAVSH